MLTIAIAVVTYLMEIYDHGTDNFLVWGKTPLFQTQQNRQTQAKTPQTPQTPLI